MPVTSKGAFITVTSSKNLFQLQIAGQEIKKLQVKSSSRLKSTSLFFLISVEPPGSCFADVARRVIGPRGNKELFTHFEAVFSTVYLELLFPFRKHHELVGVMHKVRPHPPWRVCPQTTREAPCCPLLFYFFLVYTCHILAPHRFSLSTKIKSMCQIFLLKRNSNETAPASVPKAFQRSQLHLLAYMLSPDRLHCAQAMCL